MTAECTGNGTKPSKGSNEEPNINQNKLQPTERLQTNGEPHLLLFLSSIGLLDHRFLVRETKGSHHKPPLPNNGIGWAHETFSVGPSSVYSTSADNPKSGGFPKASQSTESFFAFEIGKKKICFPLDFSRPIPTIEPYLSLRLPASLAHLPLFILTERVITSNPQTKTTILFLIEKPWFSKDGPLPKASQVQTPPIKVL